MRASRLLSILSFGILAAGFLAPPAQAMMEKKDARRIQSAEEVLRMSATAPDKGIPRDLLEKAECIGVFPQVKKGAFIVGGEFGKGVFTCRQKDGSMGAPAFFSIGGPSVGWQWGGQSADLVLLIMNETGVKHLLQDKFTLGGAASVAAGPVGRTAKAATDVQLHAEILSWSRTRGAFLGASLDGTILKPDKGTIQDVYGPSVTAKDVLVKQNVEAPKAAKSFLRTATEYSRRTS
jgi:SH3 domain-containing YSC84-like protein 1